MADSFDSSEDDVFETKSYLSNNRRNYDDIISITHQKQRCDQPGRYQKSNLCKKDCNQKKGALFQSCHNSSSNKSSKSLDINPSSAINFKKISAAMYLGNYSTQEHSSWSSTSSTIKSSAKLDLNGGDAWLQRLRQDSRDSCSTEGAIVGKCERNYLK